MRVDLAEAWLMLADVALQQRDLATAAATAGLARDEFTVQERWAWAALARLTVLRADWLADGSSPVVLSEAQAVAAELDAQGWRAAALEARLIAGRTAVALGSM